jgi:hypothetical protein
MSLPRCRIWMIMALVMFTSFGIAAYIFVRRARSFDRIAARHVQQETTLRNGIMLVLASSLDRNREVLSDLERSKKSGQDEIAAYKDGTAPSYRRILFPLGRLEKSQALLENELAALKRMAARTERTYEYYAAEADFHRKLFRRYRRYARSPWVVVEPDPDPPSLMRGD